MTLAAIVEMLIGSGWLLQPLHFPMIFLIFASPEKDQIVFPELQLEAVHEVVETTAVQKG